MDDEKSTLSTAVGWALPVLIVWALSAAMWNIAGVILVSQGHQALGPTASLVGAVVLAAIAVALYWSALKAPTVYVLLSVLAGLGATLTVAGAVAGEPSLWPSPFWRVAGAVINGLGVIGALGAIMAYFRWRARASP